MEGKQYEITVRARSTYVPEQSDEDGGRFVFAYTITITNTGTVAAKLISRHWVITDSDNRVQEVRGMGVVGEQPTLQTTGKLRVHQRHRHRDTGGNHARQLPDGR